MYFESLQSALQMDGHGVFVWSAYAITLAVLGLLLVLPFRRRRQLIAAIRAGQRREAAAAVRPASQTSAFAAKEEPLNAPRA